MNTMQQKDAELNFTNLIDAIHHAHNELSIHAKRAVNQSVTLRNWIIGFYVCEYELNGKDRAQYGTQLIEKISESLKDIPRTQKRELNRYRMFYRVYPLIGESLTAQFNIFNKYKHLSEDAIGRSATPQSSELPVKTLLERLSYTHFEQLLTIENETKRTFYEIECIQGNWSVRELKRQIGSLYYERSGLSIDKKKLSEMANREAQTATRALNIRDPYVFEFLGLRSHEVMGESALEDILLDKLQSFLLELGHGFCFEARQKRILIGDDHFFVDLVFYHRILKCHVLVELKLGNFSHEHIGQLNTYVSYYKKNITAKDDNPPIGILLCTQKNHSLVEYALSDMDNNLFVSKYQLELPSKEEMQNFLQQKLNEEQS